MDMGKIWHEGTVSLMLRTLKTIFAAAVLTVAFSACTHAQNEQFPVLTKYFQFEYEQNPDGNPAYDVARSSMDDTYNGTEFDRRNKFPLNTNPLLELAEYDLNDDKVPEIIAAGTEINEDHNYICKLDIACPHYILEVRGKKIHRLGVIWTASLDRGDQVINGYWTLKAFNDARRPELFDTFAYDKTKDAYVLRGPSRNPKPEELVAPAKKQ
ncbi:MAG: hypothetical protein DI551_09725 [Micavibrio aeruginosavorus]|uniref:Lipoprotein n=1 Tax=Micavibrio aeruginosavorus TaxID=349221 RepID=A0A2W5PZW3_9BACT|nr:MAG: hypothetical protein DI551_09725 [Micavibrio aeruginosavorus]